MTAYIQAHSFFKGFSTGLVPLTREAIVPYLVALPAGMCNTVIFYIPATSHKRFVSTLLSLTLVNNFFIFQW